jgi:Skp family chaperone for outer membrane proteins
MNDSFKKLQDELQAEFDKSNDMGTTKEEREKHKKRANDLALDLRIQGETITNYLVHTDEKLRMEEYQHVTNLTGEIRIVLDRMARKQGCAFVFDRTGLTMTGNPLVLYSSGENDLTDALIKELNSTAPSAPTPEPGAAPATPAPRGSGTRPTNSTSPPR